VPQIALIWAQAHNAEGRGVIGAQGAIPWHLPEDFAHFKQLTSGHPVVMGERTWVSLPRKPLPNRTNIVLTDRDNARMAMLAGTQPSEAPAANHGPLFARSFPQAFELAAAAPGGELTWVIGGESVYRQAIDFADRLVVTEIDLEVVGDTFAPAISPDRFRLSDTLSTDWQVGKNGLRYRFLDYVRVPERH